MSDKFSITLPTFKACLSNTGRCEVTHDSALEIREALEHFARYFKAEFRYDGVQYYAGGHDEKCVGVLFTESALDLLTDSDHEAEE